MEKAISKYCMAWILLWALHVVLSAKLGHLHEHSNKFERHRRSKGVSKRWHTRNYLQHKNGHKNGHPFISGSRFFTNDRFRRNMIFRSQYFREHGSVSDFFEYRKFRAPKRSRDRRTRSLRSNDIIGHDFLPVSNIFLPSPEFDLFAEEESLSHNNVELYSIETRVKNADAGVVQFPRGRGGVTSSLTKAPRLVPDFSNQDLDTDQYSANGIELGRRDRNGTRIHADVTTVASLPLTDSPHHVIDCQDLEALRKLLYDIAKQRPVDSLTMDDVLSNELVTRNPQLVRCFKDLSSNQHKRRGAPVKRNSGAPPLSWADLLKSMAPLTTPTPPKKRGRKRGHRKNTRLPKPIFESEDAIISMPAESIEGGVSPSRKLVTIYNKHGGTSLQILPNGVVRGTRDLDVYCIVRITSVDSRHGLIVKIKGEKTNLYLAMRDNGSLYATTDSNDINTNFRYDLNTNFREFFRYDAFQSETHGNYLALLYNGKPSRKLFKTSDLSKKTQFLRRNADDKLINALSDETVVSFTTPSSGKECKKGSKCHRRKSKKKKRKKKKNKKKCKSKKCRKRRNRRKEKRQKRTSRSIHRSASLATSVDRNENEINNFKSSVSRRLNKIRRKRKKFRKNVFDVLNTNDLAQKLKSSFSNNPNFTT